MPYKVSTRGKKRSSGSTPSSESSSSSSSSISSSSGHAQRSTTDAGLDFKRWTVVFPHINYADDSASALFSKESHFGANYVRTCLNGGGADGGAARYVDFKDLPAFMVVEGEDTIEFPGGELPEREVTSGMQASGLLASVESSIKRRCHTAGTAIACLAKETANPKTHSKRSNHVEGIASGCGW